MSIASHEPQGKPRFSTAGIGYGTRYSLLAALSNEAVQRFVGGMVQRDFREGAVLWDIGSETGHIFFPISGSISIRLPTRNGYRIEVATIGPEAAAGFPDAPSTAPVLTQAVVQAPGRFATISVAAFQAAAHDCDELGRLAAICKAWLLLQSQRMAACNAAHSADARFCRWLLRTSDALGGEPIKVTQEAIAEALGIRRTTANLIAQQLQSKGMISCGRAKITLRDRGSLESAACDCYPVLGPRHWPSELLRASDPTRFVSAAL